MKKGMSERRRAFVALQGCHVPRVPRVGDRGWWSGPSCERHRSTRRAVEVIRVSASGTTIWTRFTSKDSRKRFGNGPYQWRLRGGDNIYWAYSAFLYGAIMFE